MRRPDVDDVVIIVLWTVAFLALIVFIVYVKEPQP